MAHAKDEGTPWYKLPFLEDSVFERGVRKNPLLRRLWNTERVLPQLWLFRILGLSFFWSWMKVSMLFLCSLRWRLWLVVCSEFFSRRHRKLTRMRCCTLGDRLNLLRTPAFRWYWHTRTLSVLFFLDDMLVCHP